MNRSTKNNSETGFKAQRHALIKDMISINAKRLTKRLN